MLEEILVRAILGATIAAIVSSFVGCFTVLRGLSTMSAAIAHAGLAGALLGFLLGVEPLLGALALGVIFALLIAKSGERGEIGRLDIVLGVTFGFSAAIAAMALYLSRAYSSTAFAYLIGDVLGITSRELSLIASFSLAVVLALGILYKELKFLVFDHEAAEAMGLRTGFLNYLLIILIAVTTVIELKVVGSILAVVFLVAPAAAAYELSHDLEEMMLFALIFSLLSVICGFLLSYWMNLPTSPSIGLVACIIYLLSEILSKRRRECCARLPPARVARSKKRI